MEKITKNYGGFCGWGVCPTSLNGPPATAEKSMFQLVDHKENICNRYVGIRLAKTGVL